MDFTDDIATSISEYGKSQGYNIPFSYYQKLAYIGLEQNLEISLIWDDDTLDQKDMDLLNAVKDVLLNEFKNKSNAKGEKCKNN